MKFVIEFTDADTGQQKKIEVNPVAQVIGITIPAQHAEELPRLKVDINSDAVLVHGEDANGEMKKLWQQEFTEMIADAEGDGYQKPCVIDAATERKLQRLDRDQIVAALETASIQCYDHEGTEELRQALRSNLLDGTISGDDLPD
jgi:hypothetical protein